MSNFWSLGDSVPVSPLPKGEDRPAASGAIVDVDLHFLRKVRGLQAISRFCAQDDGSCVVSVADAMESRVFHVVRSSADTISPALTTYTVETLRKVEIALPPCDSEDAAPPRYLGISDDALYGFHGSRKSRFLSDRRAAFADVSLAETQPYFAVLFSDLLASGWAVALGTLTEGSGRLLWTKDIGFSATRVASDRTGTWIAVAGSEGDIQVFGSGRELALRSVQNVGVTAVATLGPRLSLFAGAISDSSQETVHDEMVGLVGALDSDGSLRWKTRVQGAPVEVGCDQSGLITAVLLRQEGGRGKLILLGEQGLPAAEVELGASPVGLSVSSSGSYVAVSLRDGTLAVYAPRFGSPMVEADGTDVLERAQAMASREQFDKAVITLQARLEASPADVAACDALTTVLDQWRTQTLETARVYADTGCWAEADSCLEVFLQTVDEAWLDQAVLSARLDLRARWAATELTRGREALLNGDTDEARQHLQSAIQAIPTHREARSLLAAAQTAMRLRLEREGQTCLRSGKFAQAAQCLRQARQLGANRPEIAQLLREAQVGEALVEGNRLYQERQYEAAVFHFKKVLRLAPDHAEARQRLGYAESMTQPSTTSDRFRRLE